MAQPDPVNHPFVQQRIRELEQLMRDLLEPELFTVRPDGVTEIHGMLAEEADRLLKAGLDREVADGSLLSYEYGSVIDPLDPDGMLYVQLGLVLAPDWEKIVINLRGPDD
jgi:hypothetical protein